MIIKIIIHVLSAILLMEGFTIAHDLEDAINTLSKEYVSYSVQDINICGGKLLT